MTRTKLIRNWALALTFALAVGEAGASAPEPTKSQSRLTSSPAYVPLPTIVAATTFGYAIGGSITVDYGFDVPDQKLRQRVITMRPRVQDVMRQAVSEFGATRMARGGAPDLDALALMMQQSIDRLIGQPGVRVLLANVMVNPKR